MDLTIVTLLCTYCVLMYISIMLLTVYYILLNTQISTMSVIDAYMISCTSHCIKSYKNIISIIPNNELMLNILYTYI